MKNPLNRRLPRELKGEMGKYMVIFLFMMLTIGFTSGYFVANSSMLQASEESYDKYNIEDGHFVVKKKLSIRIMMGRVTDRSACLQSGRRSILSA